MIADIKKWIKSLRQGNNRYKSLYNEVDSPEAPRPGGTAYTNNSIISWTSTGAMQSESEVKESTDTREVKKPVEVVNDILMEIPKFDITDLDKKIKVVQRRYDVFKEQGLNTRDEEISLRFLKARKKFIKHGKLFKWPTTNKEKIKSLLTRYKLMEVGLASYARNIPMEAVDEIEKFADAYALIIPEKPNFRLICDQGGPEHKKDPILLAESPFGNWWFVLGAWDQEVLYVDDLVYNGK